MLNKLFAIALFAIGVGLIAVGACGNLTGYTVLTAWGIIWRVGLGLFLIVIGVVLVNIEGIGGGSSDY